MSVYSKYLVEDENKIFSAIQGKSGVDYLIPVMTSDTAPSGVAKASSVYSSSYAFRAFSSNETWVWSTALTNLPAWLSYNFPKPTVVNAYKLQVSIIGEAPSSWQFQASNDEVDWVVLGEEEDIFGWSSQSSKVFTVNNSKAYSFYRLYITSNQNPSGVASSNYVSVGNFNMFFKTPIQNEGVILCESGSEEIVNRYGMNKVDSFPLDEISVLGFAKENPFAIGTGKLFKITIDTDSFPIKGLDIK